MTTDTLELPRIDEALIDGPTQRTDVAVAAATTLDLQKVDLTAVALAQFGKWRPIVDKLKADNAVLVLDLSKQTQVDEAKSLRERTINKPLAEARKISKALKSKITDTSRKIGEELEALEKGYAEAAAPLTKLIDDAQKVIDDKKEADRLAEEKRLGDLRAVVDQTMQKWLDRAGAEGMTAERIGAGAAALADLAMPVELLDVAAHWNTTKAATVEAMTKLQQAAEAAKVRAAQALIESATQQIQALQQQVMIAAAGRLGVRAGGTIECIRETLAETEAWVIDADNFGPLTAAAQVTKDGAIASIRAMLAEAERKAEREREDADIDKLNELANDCVARGPQYIEDCIRELDEVLAPAASRAQRVQEVIVAARARMQALLLAANQADEAIRNLQQAEPTGEGKAGTPGAGDAEAAPIPQPEPDGLPATTLKVNDDNESDSGRARRLAGEGDECATGQRWQAGQRVGIDGAAAHEAGLLRARAPGAAHQGNAEHVGLAATQNAQGSGSSPAAPPAQCAGNEADPAQASPSSDPGAVTKAGDGTASTNARYGHHPDPAIDFCVEVEAIEAELTDRAAGLAPTMNLVERHNAALEFRVGGDAAAVRAKEVLRGLHDRILAEVNGGSLETSEADAIIPPPAVVQAAVSRRVILAESTDELLSLLHGVKLLVQHAGLAFTGRFPSQPKMGAAWWDALRQSAETLAPLVDAAIAERTQGAE